jgi:hypothetical protein
MILAVGGTGKLGRRVVRLRREQGHEMRLWYGPKPRNGLVAKPEVGPAGVGTRRGKRGNLRGAAGVLVLGCGLGAGSPLLSVTSGPASDSPGAHLGAGLWLRVCQP